MQNTRLAPLPVMTSPVRRLEATFCPSKRFDVVPCAAVLPVMTCHRLTNKPYSWICSKRFDPWFISSRLKIDAILESAAIVWSASVPVFVTLKFRYDIQVLRKLPRRPVGILIISYSHGLYVLLL